MLSVVDGHLIWREETVSMPSCLEKDLNQWVNVKPVPPAIKPNTSPLNGRLPGVLEITPQLSGVFLFFSYHELHAIALGMVTEWFAVAASAYLYKLINL
jgi:hypothetical protein